MGEPADGHREWTCTVHAMVLGLLDGYHRPEGAACDAAVRLMGWRMAMPGQQRAGTAYCKNSFITWRSSTLAQPGRSDCQISGPQNGPVYSAAWDTETEPDRFVWRDHENRSIFQNKYLASDATSTGGHGRGNEDHAVSGDSRPVDTIAASEESEKAQRVQGSLS
ncbi:hypothetical protein HYALB_00004536 [Hymenoscyphus albidus]|uniref:Uncharacterized protein n=1 Tax=Hymenoscyphus albidus TaxID=595503 RepID=A0A9N9M2U4_9HELO|nr:hypothetical protein HYALB_00004536 [Hymenoscyphus albidus]